MFAAVKTILALVITCGSVVAVMVETERPGFVTCLCVAFAVGAIVGEIVRRRHRWSVRYRARSVGIHRPLRIGPAADI